MVACLVNVEKGDDVALRDRHAVDVTKRPARLSNHADGHVSRYDREWHVELAVVEVDVGAADFGVERLQECRTGFECGTRILPDFERLARARHDNGSRHFASTLKPTLA